MTNRSFPSNGKKGKGILKTQLSKKAILAISVIVIALVGGVGVYYYQMTLTTPKAKITYVLAWTSDLYGMDPQGYTGDMGSIVPINSYDRLFRNGEVNGTLAQVPSLVTDYQVSSDGMTYTMHLRSGVLFHDNTELKAEDVVFSMDRLLRREMGYYASFSNLITIGSTTAPGDYTVVFHLNYANSLFVPFLTRFYILNKDLIMQNKQTGDYGEFGDYGSAWLDQGHDAGSGPYVLESWEQKVAITWNKFPDYWGGWKDNQPDVFKFLVVPDYSTMFTMIKNDEVQQSQKDVSWETAVDMENTGLINSTRLQAAFGNYITYINCQKPPFDDIHVRRAVAWAINYQQLMDLLHGPQSVGPLSLRDPNQSPNITNYNTDLNKAREELAKSKYTTDQLSAFQIKIWAMSGADTYSRGALIIKNSISNIGLNAELDVTTWSAFVDENIHPETTDDICPMLTVMDSPASDARLSSMFSNTTWGTAWRGCHWWSNSTLVEACNSAERSTDPATQKSNWYLAQEIIQEEVPAIFGANQPYIFLYRSYVKGMTFLGLEADEQWCAWNVWIAK